MNRDKLTGSEAISAHYYTTMCIVQYSTLQYSTVQYIIVQYSTLHNFLNLDPSVSTIRPRKGQCYISHILKHIKVEQVGPSFMGPLQIWHMVYGCRGSKNVTYRRQTTDKKVNTEPL